MEKFYLGIEIGGTKLQVVVGDAAHIDASTESPSSPSPCEERAGRGPGRGANLSQTKGNRINPHERHPYLTPALSPPSEGAEREKILASAGSGVRYTSLDSRNSIPIPSSWGEGMERHRLAVNRSRGAAGIRSQLREVLGQILPARKPVAVGVGFGGPVDWRTGRICRSHQIAGWSNFDLGGWLKTLTGAPVLVDNDANVAALGEALHGAGRGANPVFYVTLGSGVGGGLVVDGRIYHGATPGEAEIGHLRLDRAGTIVETRCSGWAVDAKIRALKRSDPASLLCRLMAAQPGGEARHLAAALRRKDFAARRILQETALDLAFGLSHVVHLFHPAVIVIGGGLAGVGEPLRAAVAGELGALVMKAFAPGPKVRLTKLGADAVPVGALELARTASVANTK